LSGSVIGGRYQVIRLIGEGAMGVVYLAHAIGHPNTRCALKMLKPHLTHDPKFGRRFTDEARSLAKLSHPHIVEMHECFRHGADWFIALAFIDGMSLADMIDRFGPMPQDQALGIFKPVLLALDHGHLNGVIHRDVKPSNILVDKTGCPRLCDFGIAKQVAERGITMAGVTLGTPEYMSPEQIQAPQTLDHRTDVYSAGIVLYEMLTGRVPFEAATTDSDYSIRRQQVDSLPPDPRSIDPSIAPELARIVLKSLRKDARRRFQGCAEFHAALERYESASQALSEGDVETDAEPRAGPPQAVSRTIGGRARRYQVYEHPTLGLMAVKKGFSWPALFANLPWMFGKQLYAQAATWAAGYLAASVLFAIGGAMHAEAPVWMALGLLLALWLMPGWQGNRWCELELARRGYALKATVAAGTSEAAVAHAQRAH
jgi:hypothetical protein